MVLLFAEGDGSEATEEHSVVVTELARRGKRCAFKVSVENLKTGVVFNSPADNDKILEVMPLEYWPTFARESLQVGRSDLQSPLF